jgi:hypothetical protein
MMNRVSATALVVACVGVTACGGGNKESESVSVPPAPISATGCLTASGDRFVLTNIQPTAPGEQASAGPTTANYQLIGADADLRQHVGRQVTVNGEAESARVAEVRETTPATPATAPADRPIGTSGDEPKVQTETETRMEVAKLRVQSVTPTGETCTAETMEPSAAKPPSR